MDVFEVDAVGGNIGEEGLEEGVKTCFRWMEEEEEKLFQRDQTIR